MRHHHLLMIICTTAISCNEFEKKIFVIYMILSKKSVRVEFCDTLQVRGKCLDVIEYLPFPAVTIQQVFVTPFFIYL